jgi:RHS repeat-associated protein
MSFLSRVVLVLTLLFSSYSFGLSLEITSPVKNPSSDLRHPRYPVSTASIALALKSEGTSSEVGGLVSCGSVNGSLTSTVVVDPYSTNEYWSSVIPLSLGENLIECRYTKGDLQYSTNITVTRIPSTQVLDFVYNINNSYKSIAFEALQLNPGKTVSTYHWNYGDSTSGNSSGSVTESSNIYSNYGSYSVTLTANYNDNTSESISKTIDLDIPSAVHPTADFDLYRLGKTNVSTNAMFYGRFSSDNQSGDLTYAWNFGDGTTSNLKNPWKGYTSAGTFTVTLTTTDDDSNSNSFSKLITIEQGQVQTNPPFAAFNWYLNGSNAPTSGWFGAFSSYDPNGSIVSYDWDFGNGTYATGINPTGYFLLPGTYNVTLTVTDNDGLTSSTSQFVWVYGTVANQPPTVSMNISRYPRGGSYDLWCNGNGSDSDGSIVSWEWNWGDGTGTNVRHPQKLYANPGTYTVTLTATDDDGATASQSQQVTIYADGTPPMVTVANNAAVFAPSNDLDFILPVTVSDESLSTIKVYLNSILTSTTQTSSAFSINEIPLLLAEGLNFISIEVSDDAGNSSSYSSSKFIDTIAPSLASITPANNEQVVNTGFIVITGTSSEDLGHAYINNQELILASDRRTFSYNLPVSYGGSYSYDIKMVDLLGNESVYARNLEVVNKAVNKNLVTITPVGIDDKLLISGAPGASRPGLEIDATSGFLNSESTHANADGSFEITLDFFNVVTISAFDSVTNQNLEFDLDFMASTTLSGIIKDKNNLPLPGVKVTISTSGQNATTDSSGTFQIQSPATGDQHLILDPTTIPSSIVGTDRKFFQTTISYNIGRTQLNVMPPIYLNSLITDGTQTAIVATSQSVVTSPHAAGFTLTIPAGNANFPNGQHVGEISVEEVSSDLLTIPTPEYAKPNTVYALEPSGLTFAQPVEVRLPNDNNFPPGLSLLIMSKNSNSGEWEIDGVAEVDENGSEIKTKPGMGITHFSEIYAAPVLPTLTKLGADDQPQVGLQDNSVSSVIRLPEFRSLSSNKTPGLIYNSGWANPTIMVRHAVDYENKKVTKTSQNVYQISSTKIVENLETLSWPELEHVEFSFESEGIVSEKRSFLGIPNKSIVTYAVDANEMESGIHPYIAKFGLKLAQMTVTTRNLRFETRYKKNIFGGWGTKREYRTEYYSYKSVLDELIPQDQMGAIFVSNKKNSSVGRGWKISGHQELLNLNGPKIALEDGGGNISSYSIDQKLLTVFQDSEGISSASLNSYPNITYFTDNGKVKLKDVNNQSNPIQISTLPIYNSSYTTGWVSDTYFNGVPYDCYRQSASMSVRPAGGNIISTISSGRIAPDAMNGILSINNQTSSYISGGSSRAPTFSDLLNFQSIYPYPENASITKTLLASNCHETPIVSNTLPVTGNTNGSLGVAKFNAPFDVLEISENVLLVTDKGNNTVRKIDLSTSTVTNFAGSGFRNDSGDEGSALAASIFHPRGLARDNLGNIFVSSEAGFIRKIDINGVIHHVAGLDISLGGNAGYNTTISKVNFINPTGMVFDSETNSLFVADTGHNRIIRLGFDDDVAETVAGSGACASTDANSVLAADAKLCSPTFLHLDSDKNLVILDKGNKRIRKLIISSSATTRVAYKDSQKNGHTLYKNIDGTWELSYRNGSIATFNTAGRITKFQARDGHYVAYNYSGELLSSVVDPVGSTISYNYNSSNLLQSVTDPAGRITTFSHNSLKGIESVNFPGGSSKSFAYDNQGKLLEESDQAGYSIDYLYNEWNRLKKVTYPNGLVREYNNSEDVTILGKNVENAEIETVDFTQSGSGTEDVNLEVNDNGRITKIVPESNGKVRQVIMPNGDTYQYEYDDQGRLLKTILPDLSFSTVEYGNYNDVIKTVDSSSGSIVQRTFNAFGQLLTETSSTGSGVVNTYNSFGYLLSSKNSLNELTSYTYNSLGLPLTVTNNINIVTSNAYDSKGNISSSTGGNNQTFSFVRNNSGNVVSKTDPQSKVTSYSLDQFNRLTEITTPDNKTTSMSYDSRGQLIQITDPLSNATTFTYDEMGKQLSKVTPDGKSYLMTYDLAGNLKTTTDPKGVVTNYTYDDDNKIILKQSPNDVTEFEYDNDGNLIEAKNLVSKIEFEYTKIKGDSVVSRKTFSGLGTHSDFPSYSHEYSYDSSKNRTLLATSRGNASFSYNSENRLSSMQAINGLNYSFGRDGIGRLTSITGDGYVKNYQLNNLGSINSIIYNRNGTPVSSFNYLRNSSELLTSAQNAVGTTTYTYNSNDQLASASSTANSETFAYDEIGNRTADQGGSYLYDLKKQYLQEDYKYFYSYDLNGNLTSKQEKGMNGNVTNFNYNSLNQLISSEVFQNSVKVKSITFSYDPFGNRFQKAVTDHSVNTSYGQRYEYDGKEIIASFNLNNTLLVSYIPSYLKSDDMLGMDITAEGVAVGLAPATGHYGYIKDNLGSVTEIRNSSGNLIQRNIYSSYGKILKVEDSSGSNITNSPIIAHNYTFTGREFEKELGLYFYRARFYDQESGRFLSKDPRSGSLNETSSYLNSFSYSGNNPSNFVDPSGQSFFGKLASIGIGSLFGSMGVLLAINFSGEFSSGEIRLANTTAIIVAAAYSGGAAAGLFSGATGVLIGGVVGGVVGGVGYDVLGYGTFQDGFIVGFIAGASAGYRATSSVGEVGVTKIASGRTIALCIAGATLAAVYFASRFNVDIIDFIIKRDAKETNPEPTSEGGGSSQVTPQANPGTTPPAQPTQGEACYA